MISSVKTNSNSNYSRLVTNAPKKVKFCILASIKCSYHRLIVLNLRHWPCFLKYCTIHVLLIYEYRVTHLIILAGNKGQKRCLKRKSKRKPNWYFHSHTLIAVHILIHFIYLSVKKSYIDIFVLNILLENEYIVFFMISMFIYHYNNVFLLRNSWLFIELKTVIDNS